MTLADKTEGRSITALRRVVDDCDFLSIEVQDHDKRPLWDGHITVYKDRKHSKANHVGRIPIQVKGLTVKIFSRVNPSYIFNCEDLICYKNDGGVMIFLVEVEQSSRKTRTYYASLLSIDIDDCLAKSKAGKARVQMKALDDLTVTPLRIICMNFLEERKVCALKSKVDLEQLYGVSRIGFDMACAPGKHIEHMLENSVLVYAQDHNSTKHPLNRLFAAQLSQDHHDEVSINGEVFFKSVTAVFDKQDRMHIKLGEGILDFGFSGRFTLNVSDKMCILTQIHELDFYIKAVHNQGYMFRGLKRSLPIELKGKNKKLISKFETHLKKLKNMRSAMSFLGVDDPGFLNEYNENELYLIAYIASKYVLNIVKLPKSPFNFHVGLNRLTIAGRRMLLLYHNNELLNVFSDRFASLVRCIITAPKNKSFEVSPFVRLENNGLLGFSNFRADPVMRSIKQKGITTETAEAHVDLLLNALRFLDTNPGNHEAMAFCVSLSDYLFSVSANDVNLVNKMQVQYRKNTLTPDDLTKIKEMKKNTDNAVARCAACILLGQNDEFRDLFSELPKKLKSAFTSWPIYALIKDVNSGPHQQQIGTAI